MLSPISRRQMPFERVQVLTIVASAASLHLVASHGAVLPSVFSLHGGQPLWPGQRYGMVHAPLASHT